jgi:HTH-type transcriptional regulator / antitoxin MqsA
MSKCDVCGSDVFHQHRVQHAFDVAGQIVLVEDIPARLCDRCGDATFDRQTVEHVRRMVHGEAHPKKRLSVDVFAYA